MLSYRTEDGVKVSRNELIAVLRQAFEGLGFFQGDFENAAEMVVWTEMHGLNGLAEFEKTLTEIDNRPDIKLSTVSLVDSVWDVAGASVFECADLALGVLQASCQQGKKASLILEHCLYPLFIGKSILQAQQSGLFVAALWREKSTQDVLRCCASAGACCPEYIEFNRPMGSVSDHAAVGVEQLLLLGAADTEQLSSSLPDDSVSRKINAEQLQASYELALSDGIEIKPALWEALLKLGERVLVEATEQSRLGAGA